MTMNKPAKLSKHHSIPVVILAGGKGKRLGEVDKCLLPLSEQHHDETHVPVTILSELLSRLTPQTERIYLNANGDARRFGDLPYPVIQDGSFPDAGPLAGVASILLELQSRDVKKDLQYAHQWLISVPGDCPFIPLDMVDKLITTVNQTSADIAYCKSGDRDHFVAGIWSINVLANLLDYLKQGKRSVGAFIQSLDYEVVTFESKEGVDPFFNINTAEQLQAAQKHFEQQTQ